MERRVRSGAIRSDSGSESFPLSGNSITLGSRCKGEVSASGVAHPYLINEVISTLPASAARRHRRRDADAAVGPDAAY